MVSDTPSGKILRCIYMVSLIGRAVCAIGLHGGVCVCVCVCVCCVDAAAAEVFRDLRDGERATPVRYAVYPWIAAAIQG